MKIFLADERGEPFMGIGLVRLLGEADRLGSLRKAAAAMDLSYVKALNIVNRLEQGLGERVISRTRGGAGGGGSRLTSFGRGFVRDYDRFQRGVKRTAENRFLRFRARYGAGEKD